MPLRTSRRTVTFRRPFALRGLEGVQPAGTYEVETDEELLEQLSFPVWHRTATTIRLPLPAPPRHIRRPASTRRSCRPRSRAMPRTWNGRNLFALAAKFVPNSWS